MTCLIQVHDTIHDFPKDTHAALRANGSSVGAYPVDAGFVDVDFVGAGSVGAGFVGAGSEPAPTGVRDVIMMIPCTGFGMTTHTSNIPFGTWLGRSCQVHNPLTLIGTGIWDGIHHHVRRLPFHPYLIYSL